MKPTGDSLRNADEIWQKACVTVGYRLSPDRGDPAAAMKMLEWLADHNSRRGDNNDVVVRRYRAEAWTVNSISPQYPTFPDALAAAVVATQEKSR